MLFAVVAQIALLALVASVSAKRIIVVSVGGNTTDDPSKVFQPPNVQADQGDVVYFNFTLGNHTVTQSLFGSPCIGAHISNYTINSFDSGFRDAGDGSGFSDMLITILDSSTPIWFFDYNTCAKGGVGAINPKNSGNETLEIFQNKAMGINGTRSQSNTTSNATGSGVPPVQTQASNNAKAVTVGITAALPLAMLALSL